MKIVANSSDPKVIKLCASIWSDKQLRDIHPTIANGGGMEFLRNEKLAFASVLEKKYREKLATQRFCKMASKVLLRLFSTRFKFSFSTEHCTEIPPIALPRNVCCNTFKHFTIFDKTKK